MIRSLRYIFISVIYIYIYISISIYLSLYIYIYTYIYIYICISIYLSIYLSIYIYIYIYILSIYLSIYLDYNENLYYCNCCKLKQISYFIKFWFLRYGPECSWPIRFWDFSINSRTLKLAVSHKEINKINSFLLYPSNSFLRNGSLGITGFWHGGT